MTTLRLLLWLRWKLFLRSTTTGNRVMGAVFTGLLLLVFSPAWFGGAMAAYVGVLRTGGAVIPIAFGICQLAWISMGVLSGALGRSFDLDKFLRYPVRPRSVFAINVLASLLGPVPLMTVPTLVAVTIAAGQRAGFVAALGVGAAGACLLLVTAATDYERFAKMSRRDVAAVTDRELKSAARKNYAKLLTAHVAD